MVDWKSKLTSRKFWVAIANFVTLLVLAFGVAEETATQITAIIMAGAGVVAYVIGEGLIDAAGASSTTWEQGYLEGVGDAKKPPDEAEEGADGDVAAANEDEAENG